MRDACAAALNRYKVNTLKGGESGSREVSQGLPEGRVEASVTGEKDKFRNSDQRVAVAALVIECVAGGRWSRSSCFFSMSLR
jgi:hypothetical protein